MPKDAAAVADDRCVPTVSVSIGPVSARSTRAWLDAARATMAVVRGRPDLGVPGDVLDAFDGYLDLWAGRAADGEEFEWSGTVDVALLRRLSAHWVRLAALAREDPLGSGIPVGAPESEAFFAALASGMAEGLAVADDRERFAPKFEEVVPDFAPPPAPTPTDVAGPTIRRVLLVDDNADIRLLVRIGLESSGGFTVVGEACDGQEAVDALDRGCPDVVLLDLAMPVMDGFETLPLLKARCPHSRVVIYSASDSPTTRERVASSGGDGYLRKDAGISDVVEVLRRI